MEVQLSSMPDSKHSRRAGETAQQVKVLTVKPEDISSTPRTHMVEKTETQMWYVCLHINVGGGLGELFLFFKRHSEVRCSGLHLKVQHVGG